MPQKRCANAEPSRPVSCSLSLGLACWVAIICAPASFYLAKWDDKKTVELQCAHVAQVNKFHWQLEWGNTHTDIKKTQRYVTFRTKTSDAIINSVNCPTSWLIACLSVRLKFATLVELNTIYSYKQKIIIWNVLSPQSNCPLQWHRLDRYETYEYLNAFWFRHSHKALAQRWLSLFIFVSVSLGLSKLAITIDFCC